MEIAREGGELSGRGHILITFLISVSQFFQEDGECWVYQKPLQKRLEERAQQFLTRQTDQSDSMSSPNQSNNSSISPSSSPERSQSASNDLNGQPLIQLETTQNAASLLD